MIGLELPSKSATLAALWPAIWSDASGPVSPAFEGIRIETLSRAGAVDALKSVLSRMPVPTEPVLAVVVMRARLMVGDREAGCALASDAIRNRTTLPPRFRRDAVLAAGYCAIAGGNAGAAKLSADLIRGEGIDAPFALAVLEGAGAGGKATPNLPNEVSALDYRIGEAAGIVWPRELADRAQPGLLAVLATAERLDPGLRIVVAERAAKLGVISPETLAAQYREIAHPPGEVTQPLAALRSEALRRSQLLQTVERETDPDRKTRAIAALMEDAGGAGLRTAMAGILAPSVERLRGIPQLAWFAEAAGELLVLAGRGEAAHVWIDIDREAAKGWRTMAALATGGREPVRLELIHVERMALSGGLEPRQIHRLATVLDALDVQVPAALWEAAARTPQPKDGYLPATGVLTDLKAARDQRDRAQVVLRAAQALGPAAPADANLLTLGDVIRALKSVGLEREARAVGIEAMAVTWPRAANSSR